MNPCKAVKIFKKYCKNIQKLIGIFQLPLLRSLFFNIKIENRDKKWFRLIFEGKEWTPLMRAMELSEQIEEYKIEEEI